MTEEEKKVFLVADYSKAKWHEWFGLPPAKIYFSFDDLVKIGISKIHIPNILKSLFFSDKVIGFQYITLGLPDSSFHSSTSMC